MCLLNKKWTFWDYLQDATGIRIKITGLGPTIILGILWVGGILGMFNSFFPELRELLYNLSEFSKEGYFLFLLVTIPFDIIVYRKDEKFRNGAFTSEKYNPNFWGYSFCTIASIGFGIILGTNSLFAETTSNLYEYIFVMMVSLSFSNIAGIMARSFLQDSPIAEYILKKIKKYYRNSH